MDISIAGTMHQVVSMCWDEVENKIQVRYQVSSSMRTRNIFMDSTMWGLAFKTHKWSRAYILGWMKNRPSRYLDIVTAKRWGMDEMNVGFSEMAEEGKRYEIKRILLSSGRKSGMKMDKYYGSDKRKGNVKTFWPITFASLLINLPPINEVGSPISSDLEEVDPGCWLNGQPKVMIQNNGRTLANYLDMVDKWCSKNKDVPLSIDTPGHRSKSEDTRDFMGRNCTIFCYSPHGECIRASLANALNATFNSELAKQMLKKGLLGFKSLGQCGPWLQSHFSRVALVNRPSDGPNVEEWLNNLDWCIFLL